MAGRTATTKASPTVRATRLIGDVDALVGFVNSNGVCDSRYAPCRLGVSANGHVAIYSYASSVPVFAVDDESLLIEDLATADALDLADGLDAVHVDIANREHVLCGLA